MGNSTSAMNDKDATIDALREALRAKDALVESKDTVIEAKDTLVKEKEELLSSKIEWERQTIRDALANSQQQIDALTADKETLVKEQQIDALVKEQEVALAKSQQLVDALTADKETYRLQIDSYMAAQTVQLDMLKALIDKPNSAPIKSRMLLLKKEEEYMWYTKSFEIEDDEGVKIKLQLVLYDPGNLFLTNNSDKAIFIEAKFQLLNTTCTLDRVCIGADNNERMEVMSREKLEEKTRNVQYIPVRVDIYTLCSG